MGDKPNSSDKTKNHPQGEAQIVHSKLLGEADLSKPHKHAEIHANEITYFNTDNHTVTAMRADGSSVVRQHIAGRAYSQDPVLEIHNPPKADGSAGDIRKFSYDEKGNRIGYSVISTNKNLCSNWKRVDDTHWRKVNEKGEFITDPNQKNDEKNVLFGHLHITADGVLAFENKRRSDDESPHWTVVASDGTKHERITDLTNAKEADSVHSMQAELVRNHFDEIKPQNPVGWMGLIGMDDVKQVLSDRQRSDEQKLSAAILKKYMELHNIGLIHANELNGKLFQSTLAKMSLQDIAYDERKDKS